MRLPGAPALFFLLYLLVLLPWMALRSARRLRAARDGGGAALPARAAIWKGVLLSQVLLLFLAWVTGSVFDYRIFALPALGWRDLLAAGAALGGCFLLRSIARATRTAEERRRLAVMLLAPRTRQEWALWVATVLVASVAEEAAYRGVGMSVLWYSLGNPWVSALVLATAFAVAHGVQGRKSGVLIFLIALVMHGLVAATGTLVLAMVVHAVYDLVAGYWIAKEAARYAA